MPIDIKDILGATHEQYTTHKDSWLRDERRAFGGDAVLTSTEFPQWRGEDASHYQFRVSQARWMGYGATHAATLAGHLARFRPTGANLSLGSMGELKERKAVIRGKETLAEKFYYNVDGIGNNGREFPAWTDGVQQRALVTGHRWTMIEMPSLADVRRGAIASGRPSTLADVQQGFRPYPIELPPGRVPMYQIDRGRMDWAVLRVPVTPSGMVSGEWTAGVSSQLGYYLLVRRGYAGLGDVYAAGGWWLYDPEMAPLAGTDDAPSSGNWDKTDGEIPLFPLIGQDSQGTEDRPAMSRSLTMELDQLSVALMNRISERDYDAADAAKSTNYIVGTDPRSAEGFNLTVDMASTGARIVAVPAWIDEKGQAHMPTMGNSSAGAVEAEVYRALIEEGNAAAREMMVRQLTSTPDSSGVSKEAGFAEATSPLLSRLAANRQGWENMLIYYSEKRAGAAVPSGYALWPRDFRLRDVLADTEMGMDALKRWNLRSKTAEVNGALTTLTERGLVGEKEQDTVRAELEASVASRDATAALDRDILSGIRFGGGRTATGDEPNDDTTDAADRGNAPPKAAAGAGSSADSEGAAANGGDAAESDELEAIDLTPITAQLAAIAEKVDAMTAGPGFDSPALRILERMKDTNPQYRITPETAVMLLLEAGLDEAIASAMVDAETPNIPPLLKQPEPPRLDGNGVPVSPDVAALSAKLDQVLAALAAKPEPPPPPAPPTLSVIQIPALRRPGPMRFEYTGANGAKREIVVTPDEPTDTPSE